MMQKLNTQNFVQPINPVKNNNDTFPYLTRFKSS